MILKWGSLSCHQFYMIQQKSPLSNLIFISRLCFFPPKMKSNIYGHLNDHIFYVLFQRDSKSQYIRFRGCWSNLPQTWWLKRNIVFHSSGGQMSKVKVSTRLNSSEDSRVECISSLAASGDFRHFLVCGAIPIFGPISTQPSILCLLF